MTDHPREDLHVQAHEVALEPGLFCLSQTFSKPIDPSAGFPMVTVTPGFNSVSSRNVKIKSIEQGIGYGTASLVQVSRPATVVITVYQRQGSEETPLLQAVRLI